MVLELETNVNVQKVLNEVRSEIDRIPSFPENAEDPEVKQITLRQDSIFLAVIGPQSGGDLTEAGEWTMRKLAEEIRDDLILLPNVSQAEIVGAKEYQIDVEIAEDALQKYNLTRQYVVDKIRQANIEMPGGLLKTKGQHIRLKVNNKNVIGAEISEIALLTDADGLVTLRLKDIGKVRDGFVDIASRSRINGRPGMVIKITRTSREDLLNQVETIHDFVKKRNPDMPAGYQLTTFSDRAVDVRERMELLSKNGLQGLVLVLIVLALFLESRLAFWVAMGIPFSILGACGILYLCGHTMNMLSMFAFLMALGIVVDDAIVVGENIYTHRQKGSSFFKAAYEGTVEVLPSVAASVATTVTAFMPMFYITGILGKFFAVMPLAMIAMLVLSLFECMFILPCHLAHGKETGKKKSLSSRAWAFCQKLPFLLRWTVGLVIVAAGFVLGSLLYPFKRLEDVLGWVSHKANFGLDWITNRFYRPALSLSLHNPATILSIAVVLLLFTAGLFASGLVPFVFFPKFDSKGIVATIAFEDGTDSEVTEKAVQRLEDAVLKLNEKYGQEGKPILEMVYRSVGYTQSQEGPGKASSSSGSHLGMVWVELVDTYQRDVTSEQIVAEWRQMAGAFPEAESLKFGGTMGGPGGTAIEFRLLARPRNFDRLKEAVAEAKAKLKEYEGAVDVGDDSQLGKLEVQLKTRPEARYKDVSEIQLAENVRAFYGLEAMRIQRERFEIKIMVRLPKEDRESREDLYAIRIPVGEGKTRFLRDVADVSEERTLAEINRVDQLRSITISADVDEKRGNAGKIVADLKAGFLPDLLQRYPELSIRWEGQQQQTAESFQSLGVGMGIAFVVMFILLVVEFRSYFQPALIMAIIPYGVVGAVLGHAILNIPFSMFSILGVIALTGVVVNDSIVLIDFINHRVRAGIPLTEALLDAGQRRLRPIFLTSITTVAGLLPLMLERSLQAQILIPMAVSLCFGLLVTTFLVLFLVPTFYSIYGKLFLEPGPADAHAAEMTEHYQIADEDLIPAETNGTAHGRLQESSEQPAVRAP
jgi:HAE1 family hydrophobic/amphiphilic exporter-1